MMIMTSMLSSPIFNFAITSIGFTFLVLAHSGSPGQMAVKWVLLLLLYDILPVL